MNNLIGLAALAWFLVGCTQSGLYKKSNVESVQTKPVPEYQVPSGPKEAFSPELMALLLHANLAFLEGREEISEAEFFQALSMVEDLEIARMAARIAAYHEHWQQADVATRQWRKLAPNDQQAIYLELVIAGQMKEAQRVAQIMNQWLVNQDTEQASTWMELGRMLSVQMPFSVGQSAWKQIDQKWKKAPKDDMATRRYWLLVAMMEGETAALEGVHALAKRTDLSSDWKWLAQLATASQAPKLKLKALKKAMKGSPDDKRLTYSAAATMVEAGQIQSAIDLLLKRKHDPLAWYTAISFAADQKQMKQALNYYEDFIKMAPAPVNASEKLSEPDLANTDHQVTAHRAPVQASTPELNIGPTLFEDEKAYFLGRSAEVVENFSDARGWYEQASGAYYVRAQLQIAVLQSLSGEQSQAIRRLKVLQEKAPKEQVRITRMGAQLLSDAGDNKAALSWMEQTLAKQPDPALQYDAAMMALQLNQLDKSLAFLKALVDADPNNANALNAYGYTLIDHTDRFSEAEPMILKAVAMDPENPAYLDSLGWLYFKQGDPDQAVIVLKAAYKLLKDAEIAAHLGEALWVLGDQAGALSVWQEAMELFPDNQLLQNTVKRFQP